jgi:hypothetical protein
MKKFTISILFILLAFVAQSQQNQNPTQNVCVGSTENYNVTTSLIGSTFAWTISPASGGTISGTGNNVNITWSTTPGGPYTVQVIETSADGCVGDPKIVDVTIKPQTVAFAGNDTTICVLTGTTTTLAAATVINAVSQSWTSSGTGVFNDNTLVNPTYTFSAADTAAGTITFTLTSVGFTPCSNSTDAVIYTITPAPILILSSNTPVCETFTVNLTSNIPGSTYSWTGPNGYTSTVQNPSILNAIPAMSGTYALTVSGIPGSCPNLSGNTTIVVNPKPATSPIWHN